MVQLQSTTDVATSGADPSDCDAPAATIDDAAPSSGSRRFGSFVWLISAGFALGGFKIGVRQLHDNSFFVHLATGRWILRFHDVPRVDHYSFTAAGKPFTAQSWLAETIYGVLDRSVLGPYGIRLVMGATAAAIAVLVFRIALHECHDRKRAAGIGLVAFGVVATMFSERPLGFGLLALAVVVWIVEAPTSKVGRRPEVALPITMWLWGNVHGSMALGFAYIALHLLGRAIDGAVFWRPGPESRLAKATLISLVALCINPYGYKLVLFPLELLGRGDVLKDVVEWMSPDFHSPAGMAFAAWIVVTLAVVLRGARPSRRDVIVMIPFVLLSFWALRNLAIATLIMVPIVARSAAKSSEVDETQNFAIGRVMGAAIIGLVAVFALQAAAQPGYDERGYSKAAFRWMAAHDLVGRRLLTTDANAGWVIAAHPEQLVYMDDRYDMYPRTIIDDYTTMMRVRPEWQATLAKYRIDVVLWPTQNPLTQALAVDHREWKPLYHDKDWSLFERSVQPVHSNGLG